jgi:hypothetical protein
VLEGNYNDPGSEKGKVRTKPANYRLNSLTNCVYKTLECIINQRMQWCLESGQAGFQRFKSTEDQTTHLAQVIEASFHARKVMLAVFTDLQKPFTKCRRTASMLNYREVASRTSCAGGQSLTCTTVEHGRCGHKVLRTTPWSPAGRSTTANLLHTLHKRRVSMLPKGIHASLYADDLVLWCTEEYATTATYRMQQALNKITSWTDTSSSMKTSRRISA